jgi:hypothetical protein
MKPEFRFRVNGTIMSHIAVRHEIVDGRMTGKLEFAVRDFDLGWFSLDDNQHLRDAALPTFILHYRNETEWLQLSPELKGTSSDKGWKRASTAEVISLLKSTGYVRVE